MTLNTYMLLAGEAQEPGYMGLTYFLVHSGVSAVATRLRKALNIEHFLFSGLSR